MEGETNNEKRPLGQDLMDRWLLLFIGSIIISVLAYNVWGLIELLSLPAGK